MRTPKRILFFLLLMSTNLFAQQWDEGNNYLLSQLLSDSTLLKGMREILPERKMLRIKNENVAIQRLERAKSSNDNNNIGMLASQLGWFNLKKNNLETASDFFIQSRNAFSEAGNNEAKNFTYLGTAMLGIKSGNTTAAINDLNTAKNYFIKDNNLKIVAVINASLGQLYSKQNKHNDAIRLFEDAESWYSKNGNSKMSSSIKNEIAEEYLLNGNIDKARTFFNQALREKEKQSDNTSVAKIYRNIGILNWRSGNNVEAKAAFEKSLKYDEQLAVLRLLRDLTAELKNKATGNEKNSLAESYKKLNEKIAAVQSNRKPNAADLRAELDDKDRIISMLNKKSIDVESKLKQAQADDAAYEDSLNELNSLRAEDMENASEREGKIRDLEKESALKNLALSQQELKEARQRQWLIISLLALIIIAITSAFFYNRYRLKQKSMNQLSEAYQQLNETHEQLKVAQQQLIHSEKMASLGQLTAGIAHEIQNPLNFINNFSLINSELIEEFNSASDSKQKEDLLGDMKGNLEKIAHHGKRAEGIVKGMLLHSRTGEQVKQPGNLNQLADEFVNLAYHGLRARYSDFNSTMEFILDGTNNEINIAVQEIGRVIFNISNNAFYAMYQKERSLINENDKSYTPHLSLITKSDTDNFYISIKDNGPGIKPAVLEKIFMPFFTTKPSGEGTGLGLSLSYDIITKGHNGKLEAHSDLGLYTQFDITIPLKQL